MMISLFSSVVAGNHHCQYFVSSEDKENALKRDIMDKYRQHILEDEHSELTRKVKDLTFGNRFQKS